MIGSLFSGIGGLELGLERAGLGPVAWQVEIDPWCRKVLAKHWPNAARFEDVKSAGAATLSAVDVVCGGFPCQDVSAAGKQAGIHEGTRSGLWIEFARIVAELRPRAVVVENVASGKRNWLPRVRRDLFLLGYRTRAIALSAFDVGAPHRRARVFVLATNTNGEQLRQQQGGSEGASGVGSPVALDTGEARTSPNSDGILRLGRSESEHAEPACAGTQRPIAYLNGVRELQQERGLPNFWRWSRNCNGWQIEPPVRGVDDGLPRRLGRGRQLKALGNAVVPQCAEVIGRMLGGIET